MNDNKITTKWFKEHKDLMAERQADCWEKVINGLTDEEFYVFTKDVSLKEADVLMEAAANNASEFGLR